MTQKQREETTQQDTHTHTPPHRDSTPLKMQFYLPVSCLLSITLLHCGVEGFRVQHQPQYVERPVLRPVVGLRSHAAGVKPEELTAKLLRLDDLVRMENDVMEPKKKRSFPGNTAPLDRLSISSMETKQATNKQSKAVELPRRRVNSPPIDRIGMGRLPNSRG